MIDFDAAIYNEDEGEEEEEGKRRIENERMSLIRALGWMGVW